MRFSIIRSTTRVVIAINLIFCLSTLESVYAQEPSTSIQCGTIVEAELTTNNNTHNYSVRLAPGDKLDIQVEAIGDRLSPVFYIFEPNGDRIRPFHPYEYNGSLSAFGSQSREASVTVSASGDYTIQMLGGSGTIGAYTMYIGCTLRDGTVIAPGDAIAATSTPSNPVFQSGLVPGVPGFPGLPSVDMSNALKLPLIIDTPMTGIVTPNGNEVLGFSVEANAGDTVDLGFRKLSGNLNLGVVILSPENKVVFFGTLVLSESLSTRLTLQSAGQYTIGVYRVDLLPPDAPEATAFQVEGVFVS